VGPVGLLRTAHAVVAIYAALRAQDVEDVIQHREFDAAVQGPSLPALANETDRNQFMQVVRQRGTREPCVMLHGADRQAFVAGAHEQPEDPEAGLMAECFQSGCEFRYLHSGIVSTCWDRFKQISRNIEIFAELNGANILKRSHIPLPVAVAVAARKRRRRARFPLGCAVS
jgi:hypothetical protein